jgi:hypothetical protein
MSLLIIPEKQEIYIYIFISINYRLSNGLAFDKGMAGRLWKPDIAKPNDWAIPKLEEQLIGEPPPKDHPCTWTGATGATAATDDADRRSSNPAVRVLIRPRFAGPPSPTSGRRDASF